jgi:predicted kinase
VHDESPEYPATPAVRPILAVVCGLPATGKSTLATRLHDALGWQMFGKDDVKELLFDAGNYDQETFTRAQSMTIGAQALALLFRVARQTLDAGHSCIVEANFLPHLAPADFGPLTPMADIRQIHCVLPAELVLNRYVERTEAGQRHPVHLDEEAGKELAARIQAGAGEPLPLTGRLHQVDTTNGYRPDLEAILAFLTE